MYLSILYLSQFISIYLSIYVRLSVCLSVYIYPCTNQFQKSAWKCNVYDRVLLCKTGYVNHMESRGRREQDALPLRLGNTTCVICSKVCKSLSGLNRLMVVHKNLLQEQNKTTCTVITPFVYYQCLQDWCWFEESFESQSWWLSNHLSVYRHVGMNASLLIFMYVCMYVYMYLYECLFISIYVSIYLFFYFFLDVYIYIYMYPPTYFLISF